jgi:hypothetical protein
MAEWGAPTTTADHHLTLRLVVWASQVISESALEGTCTSLRALVQLEGVRALAGILQAAWPENADFGASTCPSGGQRLYGPIKCKAAAVFEQLRSSSSSAV